MSRAIPASGLTAKAHRLTQGPVWKALEAHYATIREVHLR
jgi:hypothetical protein